jgi:glycerol-3-phosphate dehydrogenase
MTNRNENTCDLFVIGGGINGAAIAYAAAGRGMKVTLAEARDFAEGTSSRSSKLIHGGLRYLETYDFRLVRHALQEREILMARTPHLVWPIRLVLPHVPALRPRWLIRLGLFLYDHLARRKTLQNSEMLRLPRHPFGAPLKPTYEYAFAYSDCRGDDARLVIANLLGAQAHGAEILPRHQVAGARRTDGGWSITLEDGVAGGTREIFARALVNAAGPWVVHVAATVEGVTTGRRLRLVRGSHIVVPRLWAGEQGYYLQTTDNRTMEMFPYEDDFTSIGTTDTPWERPPEEVEVSAGEIDYMIEQVNHYLKTPVKRSDIVWSYAGVRPLFEDGSARDSGLSTLTRDYAFEIGAGDGAPVLTVFGGKLTTHRRMAEDAMTRLAEVFPMPAPQHAAEEALPGGDFGPSGLAGFDEALARRHPWVPATLRRRWVRLYGTRADMLIGSASGLADLGTCFGHDLYACEVDFLMRREWAFTAEDILWRRTKLGLRLTREEATRVDAYMAAGQRDS